MSPVEGYDALIGGTAVVRRVDRGVIRLRGADRASWLQGLVTNDVLTLEPGQRIYSAYLTPQGRMITDLWIAAADDALLLDVPAPLAAPLAARFDALIFAEDVQIEDVSTEVVLLQVFGPRRESGVAAAAFEDRTYGVPATAVYLAGGRVDTWVAGLGRAATWASLEALDVLRVEAGVPRFLVDMTEETIPLEAGIEDRAISFTKGCYIGQEIIVRVTQRGGGRVAKRLVGLVLEHAAEPPQPPAAGAAIHAGERPIGRVTSAIWSPRLGRVIALGYVHRDFVEPDTRVEVLDDTTPRSAMVTALPFVAPLA